MEIARPRETILVLADLVQSQMGLENGVVAIYNQPRTIQPVSGLYVDVAFLGAKVYGATSKAVNDGFNQDLSEVQTVSKLEMYQIDIFSKNAEARILNTEIIFALTGVAAQQACEVHAMRICQIPSGFVDLSQVEASARLNRYALTFNVFRSYSLARLAPTFTHFQSSSQAIVANR